MVHGGTGTGTKDGLTQPPSPTSIHLQVVLFVAEHCMRQPSDERYPAGRSRIEPVGVIIVAVMMGIAAVEVLRASIEKLVEALAYHKLPNLQMDAVTLSILCIAVGVKCVLYMYSSALAGESGTAEALAGALRWVVLGVHTTVGSLSVSLTYHEHIINASTRPQRITRTT